jgi:hypothetical protein
MKQNKLLITIYFLSAGLNLIYSQNNQIVGYLCEYTLPDTEIEVDSECKDKGVLLKNVEINSQNETTINTRYTGRFRMIFSNGKEGDEKKLEIKMPDYRIINNIGMNGSNEIRYIIRTSNNENEPRIIFMAKSQDYGYYFIHYFLRDNDLLVKYFRQAQIFSDIQKLKIGIGTGKDEQVRSTINDFNKEVEYLLTKSLQQLKVSEEEEGIQDAINASINSELKNTLSRYESRIYELTQYINTLLSENLTLRVKDYKNFMLPGRYFYRGLYQDVNEFDPTNVNYPPTNVIPRKKNTVPTRDKRWGLALLSTATFFTVKTGYDFCQWKYHENIRDNRLSKDSQVTQSKTWLENYREKIIKPVYLLAGVYALNTVFICIENRRLKIKIRDKFFLN